MTSMPAIETHGLSKHYGAVKAVNDLNLTVHSNLITAFLGLNGSGKSTTIKMLLGMARPNSGSGLVLGTRIDRPDECAAIRRRIAYVSESKQLYDYMTVDQTIRFTKSFYSDWDNDFEHSLVRLFELPLDRKVKSLSKGMRTKLCLLLAFARRSDLLILDEPTDGLDPIGTEQMLERLVVHAGEGITIFFSSHQLQEVERIADNVCLIHRGSLMLEAPLDDLRQSYRQLSVVFEKMPDQSSLRLDGVERIRSTGHQMQVLISRNVEGIVERARSLNADSIEIMPVGLREIFLETVKED